MAVEGYSVGLLLRGQNIRPLMVLGKRKPAAGAPLFQPSCLTKIDL
jgi:hypothetical protein